MTRIKLVAALTLVLAVAVAATFATTGGAKTNDGSPGDGTLYSPGPLEIGANTSALLKVTNLGTKPFTFSTGCLQTDGSQYVGCIRNNVTVLPKQTFDVSENFGTSTATAIQAVPFVCENPEPPGSVFLGFFYEDERGNIQRINAQGWIPAPHESFKELCPAR
jgi:hypothetical protein